MNTKKGFTKLAHQFAHRKTGAQHRFTKEYIELAGKVQSAWLADIANMEEAAKKLRSSNQALAKTRLARQVEEVTTEARAEVRTVFQRYRAEIDRIASELGGHPQEDGVVLFPDGSTARMPRNLFIPADQLMKLEYTAA